jgi:uncharacterized CHY-type Zn-finger protein
MDYYILANNIASKLFCYSTFKDMLDYHKYDDCQLCKEFTAKIECTKCNQTLCGRCLTNIKACPYCASQRNEDDKNRIIKYTREHILNLISPAKEKLLSPQNKINDFNNAVNNNQLVYIEIANDK